MPRKKEQNVPVPFRLLKEFAKRYPGCFEYCDIVVSGKGLDLPDWSSMCEIPIAGTLAVMGAYKDVEYGVFPSELAALYAWRKYKEIYSFDGDLTEMLFDQADDIVIPIEILFNLPYPCIYIEYAEKTGFFVWFEHDLKENAMELRLLLHEDGDVSPLILHIRDGITISESIEDVVKASNQNLQDAEALETLRKLGVPKEKIEAAFGMTKSAGVRRQKELLQKLMQLILYICADNSEVEENPEQKSVTKKPKPTEKPKDQYKEIRKWDVGFRIGSTIRRVKEVEAESESEDVENDDETRSGSHSAKRPHSRRGHWHHFWRGSSKDGTRQLILKWVAPMFINGDEEDDVPTVHRVK